MATLKKGICHNIDGDCSKALDKEIQERSIDDFTCEECGSPLVEYLGDGTGGKKTFPIIIVAIIAVLLIAAAVVVFVVLPKNGKKHINTKGSKEVVEVVETVKTVEVPVQKTVVVTEETKQDAILEEKPVDEKPIEAKDELEGKAKTDNVTPSTPSVTSKDLGYATYKGRLKNGKMNDEQASITFKERHVIDSKDPQSRVAEAGDYVIGEFVDDHLVQGIWYDSSNTVKASIIIGR